MDTKSFWNLLSEFKVVIPIVQRDYAQGRTTDKVALVRERFLNALYSAIQNNNSPLELDFVYGYTKYNEKNNTKYFIPLDGQQRLTTLFLLHWFFAAKEKKLHEANRLLQFTYETRHSSDVFCSKLVAFTTNETFGKLSDEIKNQSWFFAAWKNDPTISSMLVMLDSIQQKFSDVQNGWGKLTSENPIIVFHLLSMEQLGNPDDLYIKMNSRGKELTEFENFKSRFSEILSSEQGAYFNNSIDQEWADLFWDLFKNSESKDVAKNVDSSFLKFFRFITDVLIAKSPIEINNTNDEFENYKRVYNKNENAKYLFSCLSIFYSNYKNKENIFDSVFYIDAERFSEEKTRLFFQNPEIDLFKKCASNYDKSQRNNPFSIGEQLMLYATIEHLINDTIDFNNRIRTLRNLIFNSDDTVRNENLQSLLSSIDSIINKGIIDSGTKFNKQQIEDEQRKQNFLSQNNATQKSIFKLEDHHLLQGCLTLFNLDTQITEVVNIFYNLFPERDTDYRKIDLALLTLGDYTQDWGNWFTQFGVSNKTWREMLTPSNKRKGYEKTREVLYQLIELIRDNNNDLELMVIEYLKKYELEKFKPKDWKYYFIKYSKLYFDKNPDGYCYWADENKLYEFIVMRKTTLGGFHWSLFLLAIKELSTVSQVSIDNYNHPLILTTGNSSFKISNQNNGFKIEANNDESNDLLDKIKVTLSLTSDGLYLINQDETNTDLEDRVEKGIEMINSILN